MHCFFIGIDCSARRWQQSGVRRGGVGSALGFAATGGWSSKERQGSPSHHNAERRVASIWGAKIKKSKVGDEVQTLQQALGDTEGPKVDGKDCKAFLSRARLEELEQMWCLLSQPASVQSATPTTCRRSKEYKIW